MDSRARNSGKGHAMALHISCCPIPGKLLDMAKRGVHAPEQYHSSLSIGAALAWGMNCTVSDRKLRRLAGLSSPSTVKAFFPCLSP